MITWLKRLHYLSDMKLFTRVTSLEQLSVAEFSGEYAMPKDYENGHKNVPVIWMH